MTKIYVRESRRAPRSAPGNTGRPQPGNSGTAEGQPRHGEAKPPSYLAEVKAQLADLVAAVFPDSPPEYVVAELWPFFSAALRKSFWNGVEGGASGRVKPNARRERRAEDGRAAATYVVSGTWQTKPRAGGAHAAGD